MKIKAHLNLIGVVFLVLAFAVSVGRVVFLTHDSGEGLIAGDKKVIRILHWQLEPGYREAMQHAIDAYNNLPEVKAANVEVRQMAVTERVYKQFINVHMISGTAPDIIEKGHSSMTEGHYTARYFEPLSEWVDKPNKYNARKYLPADLPEALKQRLETAPWRETFVDGMRGGYDADLQNYYSIPSAFWGPVRLYYNREMMAESKRVIARALDASPRPAWLTKALRQNDTDPNGYLPDSPALRAWLAAGDEPPKTLGQLLLVCFSVPDLGAERSDSKLVPIAGSSYGGGMFSWNYLVPFTAKIARKVDFDLDSNTTAVEARVGWLSKGWSFDDPAIESYHECIRLISQQFPAGFLGLDREQANRRFIQQHAMMIATGGWDAESIFIGAEKKDNKAEVFHVGVIDFPMPGPGEKWHQFMAGRASEAGISAGAPYAIFQLSPNKDWAIDFLRFLTSFTPNQDFNREAGWIPCVIGTSPSERMKPFVPITHGVKYQAISLGSGGDLVASTYDGQFKAYQAGDIDYQKFRKETEKAMLDPRMGVERFWFDQWRKMRDNQRNLERMLAVQACRELMLEAPDARDKYRAGLSKSAVANGGEALRVLWHREFPDKDFPQF